MAKVKMQVNQRDLRQLQKEINHAVDESTEDTYEFYKKATPSDGGNARRNTKYKEFTNKAEIRGDYPYAKRLDEGYSRQAPRGMSKPSLKYLEKTLDRMFRRI